MTTKNLPESGADILAAPLSVEGVDDSDLEGYVSREILRNGTRIIIPYWPSPLNDDELWITLLQNGTEQRLYTEFLDPPQANFLYFRLTPQHLANDGIAFLSYKVWKASGGTPDPSPPRKLTIDHTPLLSLDEPRFPHATLWGYLNNKTVPPLTSGATVALPASTGIALRGDTARVHWKGYLSKNGSTDPVAGTEGVFDKQLLQQDVDQGYEQVVPFDPYIQLLYDDDSALAYWQLYRGGQLIGESKKSLVKIDRVTPGESGLAGQTAQGDTKMALKYVPKKNRPASTEISEAGPLSVITIDTLADGFVAKSVLDSGNLTLNFVRPEDEYDRDEFDVLYGVRGETLAPYDQTIQLGPIAGRPPVNVPFQLPARLFPELPTPAAPTTYVVQIQLYKDSGGNADPSNLLEFVIDQTAPFNTKNPRREVRPTPTPVFVNRPLDAQVTVNEAWMTANPNVSATVNVSYALRRLDDNLRVALLAGTTRVEVFNGTVPANGAFTFASSLLRQLPNGRVNIVYDWTDLPGNQGLESLSAAFLTLAVAQRPVLNKAPLVPITDPGYATPIYLDDLASGITAIVENAFIQNAEPGDQIFLTIEDANDATLFHETAAQPWAGANLTFPLTYADLAKVFDDADEPKSVTIKSTITRTGMVPPNPESPDATFTLAFDYAGPDNPDLPDLINPNLQLPVVTGDSGTPNELLPGDRDKAGKFKVVFALTDPPITPEQTAKCYINDVFIADYIPFADQDEFEVTIPANIISSLTPPEVQAHWTIQKTGSDKNIMQSRDRRVLVGGIPITLPLPTIRIRNPANRDFIECYGMISPTSNYILGLQIPKDSLLPPGKTITAHFAAYSDPGGNTLIPNTEDSKDYVIKAANEADVAPIGSPAIFKAAQPVRGAVAYGKYWYTTDINGSQTSVPVIKQLDTISNSFNYCDQTAVPAAPGP